MQRGREIGGDSLDLVSIRTQALFSSMGLENKQAKPLAACLRLLQGTLRLYYVCVSAVAAS